MATAAEARTLKNFVGGSFVDATVDRTLEDRDPATGELAARVPLSGAADVDAAVRASRQAQPEWRAVPPQQRARAVLALRDALVAHREELTALVTADMGKTLADADGEVGRGIESVESAAAIPHLLKGETLEGVASGLDVEMVRQPVGVVAAITPFNFPAMIPLWFMPYAVACGNAIILKPSERTPMTMGRIMQLVDQAGFPPGVVNLVHGGKGAVDALLDHPDVRAISFVGSTPVARYIYSRAAANGNRVQCQGGAKNPIVILPDADLDMTTKIVADSAFGCAGQRCLASSVVIAVADAAQPFTDRISDAAASRKVGYGLEQGVEMGPVISGDSRSRIESLIAQG